jgi:hypothetical protein
LGYREVEPLIQLSVFTVGHDSKSPIQPSFYFSSAMVPTAYTRMVVDQKAGAATGWALESRD